jgi:hypothetical protein
LANWKKGDSMLIIDSLLSLWEKEGLLYPKRKVHRFNGCALEEWLDASIKRILELLISL